MGITIHPDYENDSLYVSFAPHAFDRGAVAKTIRVTDSIAVDLGPSGELIGVDLSSASSSVGDLAALAIDSLVGVKEAAELIGVNKPNFVRDFADRKGFPEPVAHLGTGRIWRRSEVEAYAAKNRRSKRRSQAPPQVSQVLASLLASDELSVRHGALQYYRSTLLHAEPEPPTIEDILATSLRYDQEALRKMQSDVESYVEGASEIYLKYAKALKSYLVRFVSVETAEETQKKTFVSALRAVQQGEMDLAEPLTRWLLSTARSLLPMEISEITATPDGGADDALNSLIQAKMYQDAMNTYERARARLRNEAFVLHYIAQWKADEFEAALNSPEDAVANARAQVDFRKRLVEVDEELRSVGERPQPKP